MLVLQRCTLCPRDCGVNRFEGRTGYCGMDAGLNITTVCLHKGEEPVISGKTGICNIFFRGCNLHCIYCQNHEISQPVISINKAVSDLQDVLEQIARILSDGVNAIGFVSPSHMVPQVKTVINGLNALGYKPITVYNTNSYDKPETLRSLEGLIDVYLPDYKYVSSELSFRFSDAADYPDVALRAIKEMYWQKGSTLRINDEGQAESGMLIRHMVLPGHAEESKRVLRTIADELSPGVHLSLMSQYHPAFLSVNHAELGRSLYREEYESVVEEMESLGFRNGFVQDMDSHQNYRPDFSKENPFE